MMDDNGDGVISSDELFKIFKHCTELSDEEAKI